MTDPNTAKGEAERTQKMAARAYALLGLDRAQIIKRAIELTYLPGQKSLFRYPKHIEKHLGERADAAIEHFAAKAKTVARLRYKPTVSLMDLYENVLFKPFIFSIRTLDAREDNYPDIVRKDISSLTPTNFHDLVTGLPYYIGTVSFSFNLEDSGIKQIAAIAAIFELTDRFKTFEKISPTIPKVPKRTEQQIDEMAIRFAKELLQKPRKIEWGKKLLKLFEKK